MYGEPSLIWNQIFYVHKIYEIVITNFVTIGNEIEGLADALSISDLPQKRPLIRLQRAQHQECVVLFQTQNKMASRPRSLTCEELLDEIFADQDSDFDVESSSDNMKKVMKKLYRTTRL